MMGIQILATVALIVWWKKAGSALLQITQNARQIAVMHTFFIHTKVVTLETRPLVVVLVLHA